MKIVSIDWIFFNFVIKSFVLNDSIINIFNFMLYFNIMPTISDLFEKVYEQNYIGSIVKSVIIK